MLRNAPAKTERCSRTARLGTGVVRHREGRRDAQGVHGLEQRERGGDEGGIVFFGGHSNDGRLYDLVDEQQNVIVNVTMQLLLDDWNENAR